MPTQRTDDAARLSSPDSPPSASPVVPQLSARRATARRASSRRAAARQYTADIEGRIIGYLKEHPRSTTGAIAKGLNAGRDTIAAGRAHIVRAGDVSGGEATRMRTRSPR
jgi:hypothetical protein